MKAVILAGGTGTRLHPVSIARPKPMVPLLDKPLLEHIILLLKESGITEIGLTLCYLPHCVTDYFGDGSRWGVTLHALREETALGTAGGVRRCAGLMERDDLLVISGDAACSFDLRKLVACHRENRADATLALYNAEDPSEYGAVLCEPDGRVIRLIEKPAPDQQYTGAVNTGIYVLSPDVLDAIPPDVPFDFAKDLFPKLLREQRRIYARPMEGYWCDIGNCKAYAAACSDALRGTLPLHHDAPLLRPGIYSASPIPDSVVLHPPCYIGRHVRLGENAQIGPNCTIGSGSRIGNHTRIRNSVLSAAVAGDGCDINGAILCPDSVLGREVVLGEDCVLADGCRVGDGCVLEPGVRLWPGKSIPAGTHRSSSLVGAEKDFSPEFDDRCSLEGSMLSEFTLDLMQRLGGAAASFGSVAAAFSGGDFARIAAEAYLGGAACLGSETALMDAPFAANAAFAARCYSFDSTLFIHQKGLRIRLSFFDRNGLPCSSDFQRKLKAAASFAPPRSSAAAPLQRSTVTGCELLHKSFACKAVDGSTAGFHCGVSGRSSSSRLLSSVLSALGSPPEPTALGTAELRLSPDGFTLSAITENGLEVGGDKLLTALAYCELTRGAKAIAIPYAAPGAIDTLSQYSHGRVLRLGRDGEEALRLYTENPIFSDGIFLAAALASRLSRAGLTLAELIARLPRYYTTTAEIKAPLSPSQLLGKLGVSYHDAELVSGVRLRTPRGIASVSPLGASLYRIRTESFREEYAEELCAEIEKKLQSDS